MFTGYILAIEYETHCDLLQIPIGAYAATCYALNQQNCRYWIHFETYAGHEFQGAAYLQLG